MKSLHYESRNLTIDPTAQEVHDKRRGKKRATHVKNGWKKARRRSWTYRAVQNMMTTSEYIAEVYACMPVAHSTEQDSLEAMAHAHAAMGSNSRLKTLKAAFLRRIHCQGWWLNIGDLVTKTNRWWLLRISPYDLLTNVVIEWNIIHWWEVMYIWEEVCCVEGLGERWMLRIISWQRYAKCCSCVITKQRPLG